MMVYLDSSALVKCYADEAGSLATIELIDAAEIVATSSLTRVEVASVLARAVREGVLTPKSGQGAHAAFSAEWDALVQVPVTGRLLARADAAVWEVGLRGYDAVQLASAVVWQERIGQPVTVATFDARLARAVVGAGLSAWPPAA